MIDSFDDAWDEYPDDEFDADCEPVGSCDECDEDLFGDDRFWHDGVWLCSRCSWIADGCPEPPGGEE